MDLTDSIVPKSDQLNAEDLLSGPRTFTINDVRAGSVEQPVDVHLVEFPGRPFKPSKTVRRIMVAAWGPDASIYAGRRMTLYRDPTVKFAGMDVGGIRVSHLSHIAKPLTLALMVTKGKRAPYVVQPLREEAPRTGGRSRDALAAFAKLAVTESQLVQRIGRGVAQWTPQDLASLEVAFRSIQSGEATVDEVFAPVRVTAEEIISRPAAPAASTQPPPAPDPRPDAMQDRQRRHLFALLAAAHMRDDAARFAFATEQLGREVTSFSQLSTGDAALLVAFLEAEAQRTPPPEPVATEEPPEDPWRAS